MPENTAEELTGSESGTPAPMPGANLNSPMSSGGIFGQGEADALKILLQASALPNLCRFDFQSCSRDARS